MAFRHGVYKSEVPTSIIPPTQGEAGLPVIIGTAPVYMGDITCVNKPVLCYTYQEAVETFGYSDDWDKWTLCEFIYSQFALFGQSPCVLINVFDPAKHYDNVAEKTYTAVNHEINLGQGVMIDGTSYDYAYDDAGNTIITVSSANGSAKLSYKQAKPDKVTDADIIGGIDINTGQVKGLELVNEVFPRFRLIPGLIGAPKYSCHAGVAAIMRAKAEAVNGIFTASAVVDVAPNACGSYTDVPAWKYTNNYTSERLIVCWPKVRLDDKEFYLSTQLIGLMNRTDHNHSDVPYKSPSNELLQMNACYDGDKEVMLGLEQANYLNSQGIVTALNWIGGWRAWGNRTAAYPDTTDPKDAFIPIRRMFDYIGNTFITTFWQKADQPMTVRLVRTIVNSFNLVLNGYQAREMILGGRVEFSENDNVLTDLMNGILRFHVYVTPPPPAEVIEGILEYDPAYFQTLYEAF